MVAAFDHSVQISFSTLKQTVGRGDGESRSWYYHSLTPLKSNDVLCEPLLLFLRGFFGNRFRVLALLFDIWSNAVGNLYK